MTDNVYWVYLENLRKSGTVNMYGATPYLMAEFKVDKATAVKILCDWMQNYNPSDYKL